MLMSAFIMSGFVRMIRYTLFLSIFGMLACTPFADALAQDSRLAVIVNEQGTPDELDLKQVKKVFRGEQQRWEGGKKVAIALMKNSHPTGNHTASKLYDMSGNELKKYWLSLVFQGNVSAPEFFSSEDALVNYVKTTPGAIGIVSAEATDGAKTIHIEGEPYF